MLKRALLSLTLLPLAACAVELLAIEVLPPRVGPYCEAPVASSAAFGRGLLDVNATSLVHGAYVGDLRISARGDVVVDGIELGFDVPEGAAGGTSDAADDAKGELPLGDVLLVGEDDAVRTALVENVTLLPRELAKALKDDADLGLSATEYATVVVEMKGLSKGQALGPEPFTFAVDVCKGCLTTQPDTGDCRLGPQDTTIPPAEKNGVCCHGVGVNAVCRPGQETPLFGCADAPSAASLF